MTYVIAAIQTLFPNACQATLAFTLVLDDYHVIHDMAIHDLLTELLHHPPRPLHLMVITRRDPPLALATLRARAQVSDIRHQDLRFTMAEIAAFFQQVTGAQVDEAMAASLEAKTEGWITGLRLATLFLRHRGDLEHALRPSSAFRNRPSQGPRPREPLRLHRTSS